MSEYAHTGHVSLENLPMLDMGAEGVDPAELAVQLGHGLDLFRDLRHGHDAQIEHDGFVVANAVPTGGRSFAQLGEEWLVARDAGESAASFFYRNVDTTGAALRVRDARPGESITTYMDDIDRNILQAGGYHPSYISLPNRTDAPGTRFIGHFPADSDMVAMGKIAVGDIAGGRDTIDNSIYLINRLNGMLPNFNGLVASMRRGHSPTISYSIERLAAAYGEDGDDVIAHYREPLAKHAGWWMHGREYLSNTSHHAGREYGRQLLLPGSDHDIVFRFSSDTPTNVETMLGLRPESAAEDEDLALRVLGGLKGVARQLRFKKLMHDIEGACESTQDFADWELADYHTLESIRTSDIAPVFLQANMVHLMRMAGKKAEADDLAEIINRRFWRQIDDTHGQYADVLRDGTQTKALHAAQVYPMLVGGIVPYERAVMLANTWRDMLLRPYGVLISAGTSGQQWSGNPNPTGDMRRDSLLRRYQQDVYGKAIEEPGDDRSWPAVAALVAEAFLMGAIEAKANGRDPGPLLEVAELARAGTVNGIEGSFEERHYLGEKINSSNPAAFVNGGEYGKTMATTQKGFGMTIGAHRNLAGRNFYGEMQWPSEYSWRQYTLRHSLGGLLVADANPAARPVYL